MTAAQDWMLPPEELTLAGTAVHIWRAALSPSAAALHHLRSVLSADEHERAARFYFPRDQVRYATARGALRMILSRYLRCAPGELRFSVNEYGKPALSAPAEATWLRFNVSHSHDLALYAVCCDREIGVDLEYMRSDIATNQLAERFFSPREAAALQRLPRAQQTIGFFNGWTRKEAYIKACGQGLSLPLDQFDVTLAPGEPAMLRGVVQRPDEVTRWAMQALTPAPGYAAAVVVERPFETLACWQFVL